MSSLVHRTLVAGLLIVASGLACAAGTGFTPSTAQIGALEKALPLPKGAYPLGEYARFYAGQVVNGRHLIYLRLMRGFETTPGIKIVDPARLPGAEDGGCSVIAGSYEIESGTFKNVACNGDA